MKARVKSTGEIVEVVSVGNYINEFGTIVGEYQDACGILYISPELDFYIEEGIIIPDYWTRLEHQYAGMAMQGILSNQDYCKLLIDENNKGSFAEDVSRCASDFAHALVEKLKELEERK